MVRRYRLRLSADSAQKLVTLLLSGTELAVQLIDVFSRIH
jgi:hypothetical protein